MRILIIRHAEPDYATDTLTERGKKEAEALRDFLRKEEIQDVYYSPMGRAKETMGIVMKDHPISGSYRECNWLHEFNPKARHGEYICWDFLPSEMEEGGDACFDLSRWITSLSDCRNSPDMQEKVQAVYAGLDEILAEHGYVRKGHYYEVKKGNRDTIVFFCHFGIEAVMLSRLINVSPMSVWQGTCAQPSSVTTIYTEERREGLASLRMLSYGDVSHLALKGLEPSFSGRFSETFDDPRRHD